MTPEQLERYARHIVLPEIGGPGQRRLLASSVLLVGAGGIGAPAALYLAAAGIGRIGLVDHDVVSRSNLQRQVLYAEADIGRPKVEAAAMRLAARNPDCRIEPHHDRLDAANAAELVAGYDLVLDGSDNFATRLAVAEACVRRRRTLVSAAIRRFEGQLAVFKPHAGADLPCYHCFVGADPGHLDETPCAELGILGAAAGVLGSWAAAEAVKELVGGLPTLAGRLLIVDLLDARARTIALPPDPACPHHRWLAAG
ncbi:MAG: molybdopterin biosynthesis protein [Rhodothalassiaceae bacterium]|nr:MAG: molybdopterin biosynthesis protein [Rhodothalassiaceae bacterium]